MGEDSAGGVLSRLKSQNLSRTLYAHVPSTMLVTPE